jgi:putative ABC transport system permease protein
MLLVLAEAFLLCGLGAALGVALGALATELLRDPLKEFFPVFVMPAETVVYALSAGLIIAVLVGLPPALRALRLSIVDALAGR